MMEADRENVHIQSGEYGRHQPRQPEETSTWNMINSRNGNLVLIHPNTPIRNTLAASRENLKVSEGEVRRDRHLRRLLLPSITAGVSGLIPTQGVPVALVRFIPCFNITFTLIFRDQMLVATMASGKPSLSLISIVFDLNRFSWAWPQAKNWAWSAPFHSCVSALVSSTWNTILPAGMHKL